jgi:trans-aconitate methyltransferase
MTYEFDGKKYKQASTHQKEWGNKIINELQIKEDGYILDLGCGDGALTNNLCTLVPYGKVLGIDGSKGMIETAKELESDNLSFILMDINYINLEQDFDLIFSNAALHWVTDHKRLLKNCSQLLKKDGLIRFNFAADENCSNFFKVVKEVIKENEYKKYFKDFRWPWYMPTIEEYKELVEQIGEFKDIEVWGENTDRYFENKEALIRWIDQPSLVPFMSFLPDSLKETFREKVIIKMLHDTLQEDGTCFETFRRVNIRMKKEVN